MRPSTGDLPEPAESASLSFDCAVPEMRTGVMSQPHHSHGSLLDAEGYGARHPILTHPLESN